MRFAYLKSLDVVGLSWLTRHVWQSGTVPLGLVDQGGGPSIQKGGLEDVFQLSGITLQLPWENLFQGTGEENWPIVEPRIQKEQCGFRPGLGTLDQLYTLRRVLEDSWEFAQPIHM